ncbi:snRNA-activating protein complex subunit 5-like [Prorops nasuta]|uniref:snRNA-activating protein complex subunit 5-like n=1 Tax=Prorops nasuta TaxID=863751 RepID=UPI0034CF0FB4
MASLTVTNDELLTQKRRLLEQKQFLTDVLATIDDQLNKLQVEQLQLLCSINSTGHSQQDIKPMQIKNDTEIHLEDNIDLSVPSMRYFMKQEEEEEEEFEL